MRSHLAVALALAALLASPHAFTQPVQHGRRAPATLDRPDTIFHNYCSVCHGEKGDGKSIARFVLDPPPADFTDPKMREKLSRAHMIETVKKGAKTKEGTQTAMVGWNRQLSQKHIETVVDYVIVNFMGGKVSADDAKMDGHEHHGHDHSHVKKVDYPYGLKPNAARGKGLYAASCASCHGDQGDGKGRVVLPGPKPRNFHDADFHEFANGFSMYAAVSNGMGHTPPWQKVITSQDIADISEYVLRTFVRH